MHQGVEATSVAFKRIEVVKDGVNWIAPLQKIAQRDAVRAMQSAQGEEGEVERQIVPWSGDRGTTLGGDRSITQDRGTITGRQVENLPTFAGLVDCFGFWRYFFE
jgi:hypothetical protein